ncbi:helix-turn-helix transcriptional regulator [Paenibacillus barcinonensis]|uniref:Helix-turn-helix protein n=1 Tax=Paenibacillus barcinonensis TaxID=198119 RepID=A0A2V4VBC0_PAEBA|nr:helix-turn-helix transcriptional regulator [Paenibacillus barcinonensis]PYE42120.1 helix-turn-helix protein [Paenibacillus barcinonensis]QKS57206.1 helix-turn-helix transcriptional regulator [Paenibacillus barcinonensis]
MVNSTKLSTAECRALSGKITLREARLNCGFKVEEVAAETGISLVELAQIEEDASEVSSHLILTLIALYNTDWNHIYAGRAEDVYRAREYVADFSDVGVISSIKAEVASISNMVTQERYSRQYLSRLIRDVFQDLHDHENKLLRPFIANRDNARGGKQREG